MIRTMIIPIINILNIKPLLFFILHNFVIDENNRNKKDAGDTGLLKYQVINEKEYKEACEKYGEDSFKVGMGAGERTRYL